MNDDLVVQKILKLLENNTAFIGYALNGGIGTKINVRNTETGKTIQALSINVDSSGEVLVVKDSEDNQYKAVTFKTAEKVSERIIQLRKTKPVDDKKTIEYTDSDIEVFYLFVKLIDTGSPVPSQLTSTWIRKGSSCTQFVGAYERCNYASKETIGGTSYTGLPYIEYETLQDCLNDDSGRDAATPHGTKDENGLGLGVRIYATQLTTLAEQNIKTAIESHDAALGTNFKKLFGYGTILECSGGMYIQGWQVAQTQAQVPYLHCDFGYFPGYALDCSSEMQSAGYCQALGAYISSKAPLFGQEEPGQPSVGNLDNSWGHQYGWVNLPYEFFYRRHFIPLYVNGSHAQGSFLIITGLNEDQQPTIPEGYFPWVPGCPSNGQGGPYDGSGGNRFPDGVAPPQKRDMKLSTHKAEIWLGSSKKTEAIKLYELGASDLFSGMYNSFIIPGDETQVDIEQRLNRNFSVTVEDQMQHEKFYQYRDRNIIDLRLDPRVWIYIIDNVPYANYVRTPLSPSTEYLGIHNFSLQLMIDNLYNRTINLTVVDKKTQIVHLKLGLKSSNVLNNTDCKGTTSGFGIAGPANDLLPGQSWEYQKSITIKIKDWSIESTTNTLDTSLIPTNTWNREYIERKFFTFFSKLPTEVLSSTQYPKDSPNSILLRPNNNVSLINLTSGNNYEQYNYNQASVRQDMNTFGGGFIMSLFVNSASHIKKSTVSGDSNRLVMRSTSSWWALWDKTILDPTNKRLSSVVGYKKDAYRVLTNFGLSPNLDYSAQSFNNNQVNYLTYWGYLNNRPKLFTESVIKSVRDKLVNLISGTDSIHLTTRENILNKYGINFFFGNNKSLWTRTEPEPPFISINSNFWVDFSVYNGETREDNLLFIDSNGSFNNGVRRFATLRWFNRMWTQFLYLGELTVDVDSYKNVEFTHPTNPTQYIKYTSNSIYANAEYSFILNDGPDRSLDTVLSPGTLDITKQVKITKPINVDLDPNMSFLVYIYPFVEVTKKKKTI